MPGMVLRAAWSPTSPLGVGGPRRIGLPTKSSECERAKLLASVKTLHERPMRLKGRANDLYPSVRPAIPKQSSYQFLKRAQG